MFAESGALRYHPVAATAAIHDYLQPNEIGLFSSQHTWQLR